MAANARPPLRRSFRLVCLPEYIPLVEELLLSQGYAFEPEPFSPWCRRLTHEPKPLGSSLAAFFGYIYIQDRSSMLPPIVLAPEEGEAVLDMCASPGSKTGFLAQMTGYSGLVLGNEPDRARLGTLRQNLTTMNLVQCVTTGFNAERLPLAPGSFAKILLDPPCSGWGTEERNPDVRAIWNGAKIQPLINLQRRLLEHATQLLAPGGRLVYSTCTTNVDENEAQVRFARDELGLLPCPIADIPGFTREDSALPDVQGALRIDQRSSEGQGFFIAAFAKPGNSALPPPLDPQDRISASPPPPGWGGQGFDLSALPGIIPAVFGDSVHLVPQKALDLLPAVAKWRALGVGKARSGSGLSPRMRCLMPPLEAQSGELASGGLIPGKLTSDGALLLNIDEPERVSALLAGQSLNVDPAAEAALLYWRGLPLGRLKVRRGRALWSL